jgi:predicted DNA binding CopG/RHH family protein
MSNLKKNKIPQFENEDQEREFWAKHDSADFADWSKAEPGLFPNLHPSLRSISLRLPESLLEKIKLLANKKDVPYQSLMKVFLSEKVEEELHS